MKFGKYVAKGMIALAGLTAGCRTTYVPETKEDRMNYEISEKHRYGNYSKNAGALRGGASRSLESVVERPTAANVDSRKYAVLGDKNAKMAETIERSNMYAGNVLAGADAVVSELYDRLNKKEGKDNFYGSLTKEQKNRFVRVSSDLDSLSTTLDENNISYGDLIALGEAAANSGNKELSDNVAKMLRDFKENSEKLRVRASVKNALNLTEGVFDRRSLYLEDRLEGYSTGAAYSDIAPKVLERYADRNKLDSGVKKILENIQSDEPTDLDRAIRDYRFNAVRESWKLETKGNISGKEKDSLGWYIDNSVAEGSEKLVKDGFGMKALRRIGWFVVPLGPGYKAVQAFSHAGASDTLEGSVSAEKRNYSGEPKRALFEETIRKAILMRKGATNGDSVVGNKKAIMIDGAFYVIQQAGQAAAVVGILNAAGVIGGSSSSSSAAPATPAPTPAPPGPIDW